MSLRQEEEMVDDYPRRVSDRRADKAFKQSAPKRDCGCVFPGCAKKFQPNTQYADFLQHYQQVHGKRV